MQGGSLLNYMIMLRRASGSKVGCKMMTTATRQETRPRVDYYCVDVDDHSHRLAKTPKATFASSARYYLEDREAEPHATFVRTFGERWQRPDIVSELLAELISSGRRREAAAIRRVLGYDDDEAAMRAYVSRLWAEDWNSPEDSVYDD